MAPNTDIVTLAGLSKEFATLAGATEQSSWTELCKLFKSAIAVALDIPAEDARAGILNGNTGDELDWPVMAKSGPKDFADSEGTQGRPELKIILDLESYVAGDVSTYVTSRASKTTGKVSGYATTSVLQQDGTLKYVLKLVASKASPLNFKN